MFMILLLITEVANDSETDASDDESHSNGHSSTRVPQTSCGHSALSSEVCHQFGWHEGRVIWLGHRVNLVS